MDDADSAPTRVDPSHIARRAGSGAVRLSLRYGLGFLLNLVGLTAAAQSLGSSGFGTRFAFPILLVKGFEILSYGVWATIVQRQQEPSPGVLKTGLTLQLIGGLGLAALFVGVAGAASAHFEDALLAPLCYAAALGGVCTMLRWYLTSLAERHLRYQVIGTAELLDLALFNGVLVAGVGLGSVTPALLAAFATRGLPSAFYLYLKQRPSLRLGFDREEFVGYQRFGLPFLGYSVLQIVPMHAAPTVASLLLPAPLAGTVLSVLGLAYRILEMPRVLVTIAYRIGLSAQSRLAGEADAFDQGVRAGLRLLLALLVPSICALAAFARFYLPWLFGPGFERVPSVMTWLAMPFVLIAAWMYVSTAVSAAGRSSWALRYFVVYNGVLWGLVVVFTAHAPYLGLPWAEAAASLLGFVGLRRAWRRVAPSLRARDIAEPALMTALTVSMAWALCESTWAADGWPMVVATLLPFGGLLAYWLVRYRSLLAVASRFLWR